MVQLTHEPVSNHREYTNYGVNARSFACELFILWPLDGDNLQIIFDLKPNKEVIIMHAEEFR